MKLQSSYPIVVTPHLVACRDFYRRWFDLEVVFEASWFVLLRGGAAELAFMHPDHPSSPPGPESFGGKGMCLEFQSRLGRRAPALRRRRAVLGLVLARRALGQRRFGLSTPRVWIDVVEHIAPAEGGGSVSLPK